jgi:hypothetical protein
MMAPATSKLTIHPWLDQPVYNRIRYPQWKLYLYNAAQKMCSSMEPTGAYFLVALDADWNAHPKNQVPAVPATHNAEAVPASIRPRPTFTMPTIYGPNSTVYVRDLFKLEKELFERIDEAETTSTLHAAIVEFLAPGTVRTINRSTPSGIASLSTLQLVGLVHQLFSTPTMQDINTVNVDLQRPIQNFEDFPDHITEHVNHYDSLASFMQHYANIAKIKLSASLSSAGRNSTRLSPRGKNRTQTSSPATSRTSPRTFSPDSTTWIKTSSPEAETHTPLAKAAKEDPKEKAAAKVKARAKTKAKTKAKGAHSQTTTNSSSHSSDHAYTNADHRQWSTSIPLQTAMTLLTPTLDHKLCIDHNNLPQIVRSFACTVPPPPPISQPATPTPTRRYTTTAPTTDSTFHTIYGGQCRVMSNGESYTYQQRQARLPSDCSPRSNDAVEPQRPSTFLKAWRKYT